MVTKINKEKYNGLIVNTSEIGFLSKSIKIKNKILVSKIAVNEVFITCLSLFLLVKKRKKDVSIPYVRITLRNEANIQKSVASENCEFFISKVKSPSNNIEIILGNIVATPYIAVSLANLFKLIKIYK